MRKRVYLLIFGFLLATGLASAREAIIRVAPPPPVRVGVVGVAPRRGYVWTGGITRIAAADTRGFPAGGHARPERGQYGFLRTTTECLADGYSSEVTGANDVPESSAPCGQSPRR